MRYLFIALRAELLKTKRSLAFVVALVAPVVVVVLQIAMYFDYMDFYLGGAEDNPWPVFNQTMLTYWALLVMPLFITLQTTLIAQVEQRQNNWKLLYTQPIPRWMIYIAKYLLGGMLLLASALVLIALMFGAGQLLYLFFPGYSFNAPFPIFDALLDTLLVCSVSALLLSLHTWISLRFQNFVTPLGIGIGATVIGLFVFGSDWVYWYPWTIPGAVAMEINFPNPLSIAFGVAGLLLIVPMCLDLVRLENA